MIIILKDDKKLQLAKTRYNSILNGKYKMLMII